MAEEKVSFVATPGIVHFSVRVETTRLPAASNWLATTLPRASVT